MEATGTTSPAQEDPPFYQRASFWMGPFTIGLGLLVAVAVGIGWYILGGFPRDHDRYGEVRVPGDAVLELPEGDVRLYFENHATHSGDSTTIDDQPPGLKVAVRSASGGKPLAIEDVPSWLFSATTNDRGHEPLGKVDVPKAGDYLVAATDDSSKGTQLGAPSNSPSKPPSIDEGPAISVGQSPWTPLDSRLAGAILVGAAAFLVFGVLFALPFRLIASRQ